MTYTMIRWASSHPWFIEEQPALAGWAVLVRHDTQPGETILFTDFDELLAWAGY